MFYEKDLGSLQKFSGKDTSQGPSSVLFAGVHGSETPGIEAAKLFLPFMDTRLENGQVIFAWGNPRAIKQGVRYIDRNLNRMFLPDDQLSADDKKSYEYKRAQVLKVPLDREAPSTALLDLHGTGNPQSTPHIICESNSYELASSLPLDTVVSGFDTYEPGGTDYYANTQGKMGICVESGYVHDPKSIQRAYDAVMAFLVAQNHISGEVARRVQSRWRLYYVRKTLEHYVPQEPTRPDFAEVAPGDVLGNDGAEIVRVPDLLSQGEKPIILFGASKRDAGVEAFLLAKPESSTTV